VSVKGDAERLNGDDGDSGIEQRQRRNHGVARIFTDKDKDKSKRGLEAKAKTKADPSAALRDDKQKNRSFGMTNKT
jgi:hypothetical protein